jgi:hypothetical protein
MGGQSERRTVLAIHRREGIREAAGNFSQAAYARVRLARTLAKSGKHVQALPIYRQLLTLPSSAVDDQGIPFTLLGASGLSEMHDADREVLDRMALELESSTALTTAWHASLTGVLEGLKRSRDASVGRDLRADWLTSRTRPPGVVPPGFCRYRSTRRVTL